MVRLVARKEMVEQRVNKQTPKAQKPKKADQKTAAEEAKKTGGPLADPYAGRRWIPRWVSIPLQLVALGIIFFNRKTAIEERAEEVKKEMAEEQEAEGERATTKDSISESVGKAIKDAAANRKGDASYRTANIRENKGEFDKPWRPIGDAEVWNETAYEPFLYSAYCTIEKRSAESLSREEFEREYLEKKPVVIVGATDTRRFSAAVQKAALLQRYGNHSVTLSSANKNSYDKQEAMLLYYVDEMVSKPQTLTAKGNETWYHFGDNKHSEWDDVFALYEQPKKYIFGKYASLSFGIGASGSGVPFHTHGHVFAEVFNGMKRWWLSPPKDEPLFGPDETSISWLDEVYPLMMTQPDSAMPAEENKKLEPFAAKHRKAAEEAAARGDTLSARGKQYTTDHGKRNYLFEDYNRFAPNPPHFYECTLKKGEMLYIPGLWWHSTLNIGETVFMSVFV